MDRRHLRAEDCVVFLHFLREINTAVCAGNDRFMVVAHLAHTNCGDQGAHTDTCGAEVVDLVDLEQRINFARAGQNIIDLISSNCIQTASEGVELDQIQVWLCLHIGSCLVEAGEWYIHWSVTISGRSTRPKWETESSVSTAKP